LPIYGPSHLEKVLEEAVVHIVVEVDVVVDAAVHMVLLAGVAVAYAVVQASMSRNHDSVLFVVLPSICQC
jgi:predicted lysophospholipase L1 biosynthesis ABC-type transport system permease subunit